MRFRPANIRVINRRRSFSIGDPLCPHPPVIQMGNNYRQLVTQVLSFLGQPLRTVLAVKGSLRRAHNARP